MTGSRPDGETQAELAKLKAEQEKAGEGRLAPRKVEAEREPAEQPSVVGSSRAIEVAISIRPELLPDGRIQICGETNLPPGTELAIGIAEDLLGGFQAYPTCSVIDGGKFRSVPVGPSGGLREGIYTVGVAMSHVRQQSPDVRQVVGENGEKLSGPLVKRDALGMSVRTSAGITIRDKSVIVVDPRETEEQVRRAQAAAVEEGKRKAEEQEAREREQANATVHVGYMSYRVWRTWWSDRLSSNQFLDSRPNAKWLFVELSVRNDDKKPRMVPPFKLVDEQGREYESSSEAALTEGAIGVIESLNPDVPKQGWIVFDVPQDRKYKLKVAGGFWSREDAYIPILPAPRQ